MDLLFSYGAFKILRWELMSKRDGSTSSPCTDTTDRARQSVLERLSNLAFPAGSRAVFAALQVAQWLVLCCNTRYGQVPFHTSLFAPLVAEILVTDSTALQGL